MKAACPARRAWLPLLTTCLVLAGPACGGPPSTGARMFKDTTYQELQPLPAGDRLLAVLRCEAIETRLPGSRSERQLIRATLLAGPPGLAAGSALQLSRFAQGPAVMAVGSSYLVAAYRESTADPWVLVEHRPVAPAAAERELEAARAELAQRLK